MVEFAHPNTHKAFHIGHLRNICLGESLVRIIDSQGTKAFRANYQGDVGLHVAKCLWAIQKQAPLNKGDTGGLKPQEQLQTPQSPFQGEVKLDTPQQKAEYLGKVYAEGGKAYEKDETAKKEIHEINKKISRRT